MNVGSSEFNPTLKILDLENLHNAWQSIHIHWNCHKCNPLSDDGDFVKNGIKFFWRKSGKLKCRQPWCHFGCSQWLPTECKTKLEFTQHYTRLMLLIFVDISMRMHQFVWILKQALFKFGCYLTFEFTYQSWKPVTNGLTNAIFIW